MAAAVVKFTDAFNMSKTPRASEKAANFLARYKRELETCSSDLVGAINDLAGIKNARTPPHLVEKDN